MSKYIKKVTKIESLPGEVWREIDGYSGDYEISNLGRVASHVSGRFRSINKIMSPGFKPNGYLKVSLGPRNKSKNHHIHRLVLLAFGAPANGKTDVNHIDGNKLNNALTNLEWASRSENMRHAMRIGLWSSVGERNPQAKLIPADVKAIRTMAKRGEKTSRIAELYSVCRATINDITAGRKWRHVA